MTSNIISEILNEYTQQPFYIKDGYVAINDDRVYRIVMFQLTTNDKNEIIVNFKEILNGVTNAIIRTDKQKIRSLKDFKNKWYSFYNDLH